MPPPGFDLYLVTDRHQAGGRDLLWVLERALEGGVRAIQLREKDLCGKVLFELAVSCRALCDRHGASFFINDRVDIALSVGADGVQLSKTSIPIGAARKLLGPGKSIGASVHSVAEAREAEREGADFIVFGPIYFTPSKAAYGAPQGLTRLKEIVEKISLPVYPIGGIKRENASEVRQTGAGRIALISAILSAADPKMAAESILRQLRE